MRDLGSDLSRSMEVMRYALTGLNRVIVSAAELRSAEKETMLDFCQIMSIEMAKIMEFCRENKNLKDDF